MLHLMKYVMKVKLHDFSLLFWPFMFPLILATLFYFAFGSIDEADFETVPVAIVKELPGTVDEAFLKFLNEIETDESKMIRTEQLGEKEALKELGEKKIAGIYYMGDKPSLTVGGAGVQESILQSLLESYDDGRNTMEDIAAQHPEGLRAAAEQMGHYQVMVEQVSLGGKTINGSAQYFYALIAMACMYGSFIGLSSALTLQANLTALGARRFVTPSNKLKLVLSEMIVSFLMDFLNVAVLLLYLKYVLKMEFQDQMTQMLLVIFFGCMIGVSIGIFIGSLSKQGEGIKIAILLAISMTSSFLAGLMTGNMKDIVEQNFQILNRINPAALISDAFYCINVYDDQARLNRSLMILTVMSAVFLLCSFMAIRRERYDSI